MSFSSFLMRLDSGSGAEVWCVVVVDDVRPPELVLARMEDTGTRALYISTRELWSPRLTPCSSDTAIRYRWEGQGQVNLSQVNVSVKSVVLSRYVMCWMKSIGLC